MNLFKVTWNDGNTVYSKIIEVNDLLSATLAAKSDIFGKGMKLQSIEQVFVSPKQFINKPKDRQNDRYNDSSSYGSRHYKSDYRRETI